jgi:hypothetical protein
MGYGLNSEARKTVEKAYIHQDFAEIDRWLNLDECAATPALSSSESLEEFSLHILHPRASKSRRLRIDTGVLDAGSLRVCGPSCFVTHPQLG